MHHGVIKGAMLALLLIIAPAAAHARPASDGATPNRPEPAAGPSAGSIVIAAVRVEGAGTLSEASFAAAVEPYLHRPLLPADLRGLATEIANTARRAGLG